MNASLTQIRLTNQQLVSSQFNQPQDVVSWFGAMQAQDFAAAKWAIALRTKDQTDATLEKAFDEGKILRTHIMRPTWHFVTPADIRWILALTSPRVHRFNGYYYRKSGLDKTIFEKSNEVIKKVLQGKQMTRNELDLELQKAKIPTQNLGLSYTIMQAELDGIICSGPRRGKQFTYMLLDERVPTTHVYSYDESLTELTKRYFQSHGPAQVQDFAWWSGLTLSDVKKGIALLGPSLEKEERDEKTYWFFPVSISKPKVPDVFLVPGFDEYFIAYKDRNDILDKKYTKQLNQGGGMVSGAIVIGGKMLGGWRRTFAVSYTHLTLPTIYSV